MKPGPAISTWVTSAEVGSAATIFSAMSRGFALAALARVIATCWRNRHGASRVRSIWMSISRSSGRPPAACRPCTASVRSCSRCCFMGGVAGVTTAIGSVRAKAAIIPAPWICATDPRLLNRHDAMKGWIEPPRRQDAKGFTVKRFFLASWRLGGSKKGVLRALAVNRGNSKQVDWIHVD